MTLAIDARTDAERTTANSVSTMLMTGMRLHESSSLERTQVNDNMNRELQARLTAANAWAAEVESYYLQARSFGLLLPEAVAPSPDWTLGRYLRELRQVPATVRAMDLPTIPERTNEEAVSDLTQLVSQEDRIAGEIGGLRRRLTKLDQLSSSISEYGIALTEQEDRL